MLQSIVTTRGAVDFAPWKGDRIYMRGFTKKGGLPSDINQWQRTVDMMLDGIDTDGPVYLMVDQALVRSGATHRRPGVHIDGYWNPGLRAWDTPGPGWLYGSHNHGGGHITEPRSGHRIPGHRMPVPTEDKPRHRFAVEEWPAEAIILASNAYACDSYHGLYDGIIGEGGDCEGIDVSQCEKISMSANTVYAGNVTMLHESIPVQHDVLRTVVRLNVPGWSP